jgi:hypothetical protein
MNSLSVIGKAQRGAEYVSLEEITDSPATGGER